MGKVTVGINIQGIVVTIGDNIETFLLGFRVVPPKHEGSGVQPRSKNEWLIAQLERIERGLKPLGLSLKGIPLSVDCAYASKAVKNYVDSLEMTLISKVKRSWRVNPTEEWPWSGGQGTIWISGGASENPR